VDRTRVKSRLCGELVKLRIKVCGALALRTSEGALTRGTLTRIAMGPMSANGNASAREGGRHISCEGVQDGIETHGR
jgi:hypothetical protein